MTTTSQAYTRPIHVDGQSLDIFSLNALAAENAIDHLPFCYRILLENMLRHRDGISVNDEDIQGLCEWQPGKAMANSNISFYPSRVVLQDFTGVPAIVDLAAMRDAVAALGGKPGDINPIIPVDLVIDHSVMVDHAGSPEALQKNIAREFERNGERYGFLRWGQKAFRNFRVVPPGTGIVHQVNLEYLAHIVTTRVIDGKTYALPDTLVGTDSHTTMINGLGVLGWGVGGIEAEVAMLGQPLGMLLPKVVGVELRGEMQDGVTATDLVLTLTQQLRKHGVVSKFVEFFGEGLAHVPLADRATIANMSPEYGATVGIFPIDDETLNYLSLTGRSAAQVQLVERYAKVQGMWRQDSSKASYDEILTLDLSSIEPCLAGPKRPQDRVPLTQVPQSFSQFLNVSQQTQSKPEVQTHQPSAETSSQASSEKHALEDGDVVIAAITSCTNTSNPMVMLAAGLVAKKAREKGLETRPWVKTSFAPGSQVVPAYLEKAGLSDDLRALGFHVVGFGCTTCIGNSGPLHEDVSREIKQNNLSVASVLSGNRNFEGRIHAEVKANYLASPPLVVAYALAGNIKIDISKEALASVNGRDVYLKDIWPSTDEIKALASQVLSAELYTEKYADIFEGPEQWQKLPLAESTEIYPWPESTYIKKPSFFADMEREPGVNRPIEKAHCLVKVGDSITTDHISPAGAIKADGPAGLYLQKHGVEIKEFNSFGSRRGNHEVMMRGTFANIRLKNHLAQDANGKQIEGGYTQHIPSGKTMSIFEAAEKYKEKNTPLVVLAGKEYGTGSSRDWAAKGSKLLGIEAVIAESFERIHRSNLVGFGILPLQFLEGESVKTLQLTGTEKFTITPPTKPGEELTVIAESDDAQKEFKVTLRIDTEFEWEYYLNGGILHTAIRKAL